MGEKICGSLKGVIGVWFRIQVRWESVSMVASVSVVYLYPAVILVSVYTKATIAGTFRINSYLSSKGDTPQ
ncbi:hypothetical protein DDD64_07095, partial [Actinotignum sanguinis]